MTLLFDHSHDSVTLTPDGVRTAPTLSGLRVVAPVDGRPHDGLRRFATRGAAVLRDLGADCIVRESQSAVDGEPADVCWWNASDRLVTSMPVEFRRPRSGVARVVTLHDLPTWDEGVRRRRRRAARYVELAASADVVVVCSEYEARLASSLGVDAVVARHPLFDAPSNTSAVRSTTIVLAGHVHPGKGVEEFLLALGRRGMPAGWSVRLVGGPSAGHGELASALERAAHFAGVALAITGPVSDEIFRYELATAGVPVIAHRHCSASGSLMSWLAAGRRPIARRLGFVEEIADLAPGSVTLAHDDDDIAARAIGAAFGRGAPTAVEVDSLAALRTDAFAASMADALLQAVGEVSRRSATR